MRIKTAGSIIEVKPDGSRDIHSMVPAVCELTITILHGSHSIVTLLTARELSLLISALRCYEKNADIINKQET